MSNQAQNVIRTGSDNKLKILSEADSLMAIKKILEEGVIHETRK
jgi:hypothetical protein